MSDHTDAIRTWARLVFSHANTDKTPPAPTRGNHAPGEGNDAGRPPRRDMHDFTARLFGRDQNN